ncbi:hypothetical protein, partial [Schleiferia thermophila]|uniref:hypothetical protein n=1 Tax=Schleiferia thermophila TaxID=884107 RepID=UPI0005637EF9
MVVPGSVVEKPAFGVVLFGTEAIGGGEARGVRAAGLCHQAFPPRAVVEVLVRHSGSIGHILHMTKVVRVIEKEDVRGLGMVLQACTVIIGGVAVAMALKVVVDDF